MSMNERANGGVETAIHWLPVVCIVFAVLAGPTLINHGHWLWLAIPIALTYFIMRIQVVVEARNQRAQELSFDEGKPVRGRINSRLAFCGTCSLVGVLIFAGLNLEESWWWVVMIIACLIAMVWLQVQ